MTDNSNDQSAFDRYIDALIDRDLAAGDPVAGIPAAGDPVAGIPAAGAPAAFNPTPGQSPHAAGSSPPTSIKQADAYYTAMSLLARERAPRRLQDELLSAARNAQPTPAKGAWWRPAVAVAAAVLIALFIGLHDRDDEQAREIARGKRELAFALAQLDRATSQTRERLQYRLQTNIKRPLTDRFITVIGEQLDLNQE